MLGVVLGNFVGKVFESLQSFVRTFVQSARIRVRDEFFVEVGVKHSIDCVVEKSVSHCSFVDVSGLGVRDVEGVIIAMSICFVLKVSMQ